MGTFGVISTSLLLLWCHPLEMGVRGAVTRGSRSEEVPRYHYYVFPMPTPLEREFLPREARQETGSGNDTTTPVNLFWPSNTFSNVATIVTGLFQQDVQPILNGSTAFIPAAGGLREGISGLLQTLAPTLQNILFRSNSSEGDSPSPSPVSHGQGIPIANFIPQSPQAFQEPVAIKAFVPRDTSILNALPASQLKVVVEEPSSIVTANVVSNPDGGANQYVFLALVPEQFENRGQLIAASPQNPSTLFIPETSMSEPQPLSTEPTIIVPVPVPSASSPSHVTTPSNRYTIRKIGTTVSPPPHLQLQTFYRLTPSTTAGPSSTDLPGVKGFDKDNDELNS